MVLNEQEYDLIVVEIVRGLGRVSDCLVPVIEKQNPRGPDSVEPWKERAVEVSFLQAVRLSGLDRFLPVEVFL